MKPRPGALVLLFGLTADQEKLVRITGLKWGLRCRAVPATQYETPLGELVANRPSETPYEGTIPETQALLLSGIPSAILTPFLQQLRKAGLPTSVLKAVLTPDNRHWTPLALLEELTRERDAIGSSGAPAHGQDA